MIHARPSLATVDFFCLQYLLRKPIIYLFIAALIVLLLFHQLNSDHSSYYHSVKLTRRNTTDRDFYHHNADGQHETNRQKSLNQVGLYELRIDDLKKIKNSISNELRSLERDKAKLLKEKNTLTSKNEKLVSQIAKSKAQLKQLETDISANRQRKNDLSCDDNGVSPVLFRPLNFLDVDKFLDPGNQSRITQVQRQNESKYNEYLFDLSLCSLTSDFKFYVDDSNHVTLNSISSPNLEIIDQAIRILQAHSLYTSNVDEACLHITLIDKELPHIQNSKRNNLIINLGNQTISTSQIEHSTHTAVASSSFTIQAFRRNLDLIIPCVRKLFNSYETVVGSIPPQSPIGRKYLASYFGHSDLNRPHEVVTQEELNPLEKTLQIIHRNSIDDLFLFIYDCGPKSNIQCYDDKEKMIELSTFLIIIPNPDDVIDEYTNDLLYLALSRGSIPVIIGRERTRLPFDEAIDWRRAAILLPTARLPEMHFILRSIGPGDLYSMKYHGRRIFENYLATAKQVFNTIISVMSLERFNYPPPPIQSVQTPTYDSGRLSIDTDCASEICLEAKASRLDDILSAEILGPHEQSLSSQSYRRNFSLVLNSAYDLWNDPIYSPHTLFPSYPVDPVLPSEYKFLSPDQGFRPIGGGLGGSGYEFSRALGGDYSNEQFTIVLLTYNRKEILMKTLERLKGVPYLNKVLVIWNGVKNEPTSDMIWPDLGVPLKVVKMKRNSLNNRFLPFDEIDTDAVLSLDDDSPLRPDEIVFAFRVWRQSRDRIVGFPGRYHAWDAAQGSWMYNSNHSCELSMVLTGGAFFHKYYSYIYTFSMPEAIRLIVDKFMNCEDIAMNFLVSHLTRKPPIKVTSRWTFHCANCPSSLSEDDSHFRERHECLNTFVSIYGYMPLLNTQHRADSVLFKTRIPHDKQKCFKYV